MRIAIAGAGISGLTAAYLLHRRHEITVFEAGGHAGGHTNTIDIEYEGERHALDTGFIVFNNRNYPNFTRLLAKLGVASQPAPMGFSVRDEASGLEYNGASVNRLFAQRGNLLRPRFLRMVRDILRFHRRAREVLSRADDGLTVEDYAAGGGYSREFFDCYLVPLGASLWSCPAQKFRGFPIRFVVEFLDNYSMLQVNGRPEWRAVQGGSSRYVEAMTRGFRDRIRLNSPVRAVTRCPNHVRILNGDGQAEYFDHVILACHADQALRLLTDGAEFEHDVLEAFPYEANMAVLHTDCSVLPRSRRAWASWNYALRPEAGHVSISYNLNLLQSLRSKRTFLVTLNEDGRVDPAKVIRRIPCEHPLFTARRGEAQRRQSELLNRNRTSFCGAYWGYGFHEDGVNSALRVCETFGETL